MRLWLCLVEPDADEAERISTDQPDAGLAWLETGMRLGYVLAWNSYANEDGTPRTGGYMIVVAPDRDGVWALLEGRGIPQRYPLLDTIRAGLDIRPLNEYGPQGFAVLRAEVAVRGNVAVRHTFGQGG